ncbi:MAG: NfeD family protein [Nocardioides marinisabuli]|uniref:NfeD family protein n=1 Tax=Nocardioides marinisabuli TaxID=419476 RepID=UPI00321995CD
MTTYLLIAGLGLVLLLVSLVLGDLLDGALDALAGDAFSSAVIGAFVSALGFGGALAQGLGAPLAVSLPAGVVAGVGFGWFAAWLTRLLRTDSSGASPRTDDTVGREAVVVTAIPADGYGTVKVLIGGHEMRLNARLDTDHPLPVEPGTRVHVTGSVSPTAVTVAPTWRELG